MRGHSYQKSTVFATYLCALNWDNTETYNNEQCESLFHLIPLTRPVVEQRKVKSSKLRKAYL